MKISYFHLLGSIVLFIVLGFIWIPLALVVFIGLSLWSYRRNKEETAPIAAEIATNVRKKIVKDSCDSVFAHFYWLDKYYEEVKEHDRR